MGLGQQNGNAGLVCSFWHGCLHEVAGEVLGRDNSTHRFKQGNQAHEEQHQHHHHHKQQQIHDEQQPIHEQQQPINERQQLTREHESQQVREPPPSKRPRVHVDSSSCSPSAPHVGPPTHSTHSCEQHGVEALNWAGVAVVFAPNAGVCGRCRFGRGCGWVKT